MAKYIKHEFIDANENMSEAIKYINSMLENSTIGAVEDYVASKEEVLGTPITAQIINDIENKIVELEYKLFQKYRRVYLRGDEPLKDARLDFIKDYDTWIGGAKLDEPKDMPVS